MSFALCSDPLPARLLDRDTASGAYVVFTGCVRALNLGRTVESLQYDAFDELALVEGNRILEQALIEFAILRAACIHRTGPLKLGEDAILIEVAARHRREAFRACEWILEEIKSRVPIWKKEFYSDGESEWIQPKICADPKETDYYSRQVRLAEVGEEGQSKLRAARVLVIGAGGLGCAALPYLAAAGVGTVAVCDPDIVEVENLSRQVLFGIKDIGQPKVEVAAKRLRELNPFIQVLTLKKRFHRELAGEFDLLLDCTDSLTTKFDVNESSVSAGKRALIGGIYRYEGQLQLVQPNGPCLACLWPEQPAAGCVGTCAEVGVLGAVPGVLGTLMAAEAIKLILGLQSALTGGSVCMVDLIDLTIQNVRISRDSSCAVCGDSPRGRGVPMELVPELLADYRVVDIREEEERLEEPFPYPLGDWMPLSSWTGSTLDERPTLFVCHRGIRSLGLVKCLRSEGRAETFSLPGGTSTLRALQASGETKS